MNAPLRNGLVMLPQHVPPADANALLPGALELLRITGEAWGPLRDDDAAPMPHTVRKRWAELRRDYRRSAGCGYVDAENQEWFSLPEELRAVILLLAHIDGDLNALANRDWRETPPAERSAIKCAMRSVKRHSARVVALASLW